MNTKAFTLIELLVVIAILAVLAVAVTLILNPAELIRQGRDSTRLSDLATINRALGLYQTDQIAKWMGTSTVVYTSLPDTTSTCASYGLPSLPSGWEYNCVQESSSTRVDGTGWIPVDFTSMSFSSPLSRLPLDPVNNATTSKYYTYISGGSWELSAVMEASSNKLGGDNDRVSGDGGEYMDVYETGTNLELLPVNRNPDLVGYWEFDEGSGTNAYDASGNGNDGTISVGTSSVQWVSGRKGDYALEFDGVDDGVNLGQPDSLQMGTGVITVSAWIYPKGDWTEKKHIFSGGATGGYSGYGIGLWDNSGYIKYEVYGDKNDRQPFYSSGAELNKWQHLVAVFDGINNEIEIYLDGNRIDINTIDDPGDVQNNSDFGIGTRPAHNDQFFNGSIDDVRIYNRALSATEIEAMYNSY